MYRIFLGTGWTTWAPIPTQIDFDLGLDAIEAGYEIKIEVKNMYGVSQEQILVYYDISGEPSETISGFPNFAVSIIFLLGVSIVIYRHRKKSRY